MFQCQYLIRHDLVITDLDFYQSFKRCPDAWQLGKVSAKERTLFTEWTCDAVEKLMSRRDIIRRAFRGTGVGIDAEGKMKEYKLYPGFESYIPPEFDEEHELEKLTKRKVEELEKKEEKYQKEKKKRKMQAKDNAIRERARKRMKGL